MHNSRILTFRAIVSLPPGEADALSGRRTAEMPETVVSGSAEVLASLAVVMRIAGDPVLELECRIFRRVHVIRPILSYTQPGLRHQTTY